VKGVNEMGKRLVLYKSNIKVQYEIYSDKEKAYQYNRGYIRGLADGKAISNKSGFALIELNHFFRRGGKNGK
jgi:hypothetical protein